MLAKLLYVLDRISSPVEDRWTKTFDWVSIGMIYGYVFAILIDFYWISWLPRWA